ncbi:MAG TPA: alpha/beta hydrolase [Acidimicrobiales bacterium]|nr:alpha/beta hydrolase [Acidimicrobiales bacterium]
MGPDLSVTDRGRGRPVLAVHGQPGLATDWDAVAGHLEHDHRFLAPDRPGYGRSGGDPLAMAANAEVLADLLLERRAAPATVVGHSYGGGIAALLAARRPDLVSALVLVAPVGRADSIGALDHLLAWPWAGEALTAAGLLAFGRVLPRLRGLAGRLPGGRLAWLEASLPDRHFVELTSHSGRQIWRSFVFEQRALMTEISDVERAFPHVGVPTVVITGTWDVVVPSSVAATVATAITGSELVTVARTGHFIPRDQPRLVADAVRRVEARTDQ